MKCNNCGTDNDEKSEVCSGCGQPLKGEDPPKAPDANGANKDGANGTAKNFSDRLPFGRRVRRRFSVCFLCFLSGAMRPPTFWE